MHEAPQVCQAASGVVHRPNSIELLRSTPGLDRVIGFGRPYPLWAAINRALGALL
ncbi:MAG TPA: hypothetical protein VF331_21440 [Polyangiales bacterium]